MKLTPEQIERLERELRTGLKEQGKSVAPPSRTFSASIMREINSTSASLAEADFSEAFILRYAAATALVAVCCLVYGWGTGYMPDDTQLSAYLLETLAG